MDFHYWCKLITYLDEDHDDYDMNLVEGVENL